MFKSPTVFRMVQIKGEATVSSIRTRRSRGEKVIIIDGDAELGAIFFQPDQHPDRNLNGHKAFRVLVQRHPAPEYLAFDPDDQQWYLGPLGTPEQIYLAELFEELNRLHQHVLDEQYREYLMAESSRLASYIQDQDDL